MRNERGGIFVELSISLSILLAFYAGTLAMHRSAGRRFQAILRLRNESIEKIRREAELLPRTEQPDAGRLGLPSPR